MMLILGRMLQFQRRPPLTALANAWSSAAVLLVAALTLLPVGQLTLRPLEDRFPQPDLPARIDGIILLGGSVNTEMTADRGQPVLNSAGERITEFVALARRYPEARLIFTGGSGFVFAGDLREADVIRHVLDGLGLRHSRASSSNASCATPMKTPSSAALWSIRNRVKTGC